MDNDNMDPSYTSQLYDITGYYVGVCLAVLSTFFIGTSFIIKKKALIRIQSRGSLRAAAGGFGYLKEWLWWAGLVSMGIGEAANFAAYAFAPASLVTPLGALSILVSAVLAAKFLHERLNILGKLGCLLCIFGSTVIVIHSPKEEAVENLTVLLEMLQGPFFLAYVCIVLVTFLLIYLYFGPKYAHRNVIVYILLCSAVGSLSVMGCKGLGLALKETITGTHNELTNWLTWFFLLTVVVCITVQMNYLNKALDLFSIGIVTPVYYVLFTTLVILASSILFREWQHLSASDVIGNICGFGTIFIAIVMLNGFKDIDVSLNDIRITLASRAREEGRGGGKYGYGSDEEVLIGKEKQVPGYGIRGSR